MCDRQKAYNNSKPIHKYHYGAEKNFVHANVCKIFFLARDTDTFRSLRIIIISEVFSFFEPHSRPPYILKKCTIDDSLPADQVVEHQAELVDKRSKITCTLENRTKTKQVVYLTPSGLYPTIEGSIVYEGRREERLRLSPWLNICRSVVHKIQSLPACWTRKDREVQRFE